MVLSCGVLLLDESGCAFLAHATGTARWDLPKGHADEGEPPFQAAVRETEEETGLDVGGLALQDLGERAYRPGKRLHVFAARVLRASVDLASCRCRTVFVDRATGRTRPEMDGYAWIAPADWPRRVAPNMFKFLVQVQPLVEALPLQSLQSL
jgi:8-oxo-dGTP pyrophosphatase MutT (NUDIX family)